MPKSCRQRHIEIRRPPARQLVSNLPRARQVRNACGVELEGLYRTILLLYPHIQRTGDGIIEVLIRKGPAATRVFIQHAPLLADDHPGVGLGQPHHFRCVTAQVGGS